MPYKVMKNHDGCNGWAVVSTTSGKTHGCHSSKAKAQAQQRALHVNAPASAEVDILTDVSSAPASQPQIFFVGPGDSATNAASSTMTANTMTVTFPTLEAETEEVETESEPSEIEWEGILGIEGKPTDDKRYLMPGEISERELPLSLMVQTVTDEGHRGAQLGGKITEIWRVEDDDGSIQIWGRGPFDSSEFGQEAARLVEEEFLTGVSLDLAITEALALDSETFEPLEMEDMDLTAMLTADYVTGIKGTIMGATLVPFAAFADTKVSIVTAGANMHILRPRALVAAAGPLKPPTEWFEDPHLIELTPLQITKEGRVYGHLADWDGCHTGFQGICVPPFRSASNYAYFNVGQIETAEGEFVPCGKIMFCREGNGHADLNMSAAEAAAYYDDATKVGAFVRAGSDRYGTWLAGVLRSDLADAEIQHLRTHPPSGDWRPVKGGPSELIAAFAVPIPGFPIARQDRALVASANGEITAIITGPLVIEHELGARARRRKQIMLAARLQGALGYKPSSRRRRRKEAMEALDISHKEWYSEFKDYPAATRKRMAKSGSAMPDGSYPIADCEDVMDARRSIGRSPASRRNAVRTHINKRANALGCSTD